MKFEDYRDGEYVRLKWNGKAVKKVSRSFFVVSGKLCEISPQKEVIGADPIEQARFERLQNRLPKSPRPADNPRRSPDAFSTLEYAIPQYPHCNL